MHRLHESLIWRYVAIYVAASMALPYAVIGFPAGAIAQPQPVVGSATSIVLPILDPAGSHTLVESENATDALALALEDSRQFIVTSKRDLARELASLGMKMPLSDVQQVKLAARMKVDKVISGRLVTLAVNEKTGECTVRLQLKMLDAETAEYLDGVDAAIRTSPIPGWIGERNQAINAGLREVAETAVAQMLGSRIRPGYVLSVNNAGVALVDLGAQEGVVTGREMVLMRETWQRDLDDTILVKVGRLAVGGVESDMCFATPLSGGRAMVGDSAYMLYTPPARVAAQARSRGVTRTVTTLMGLGLLLGLVSVAQGPHVSGPPHGVGAHLFQQAPGDQAVIRVHVDPRWVPLREQVFGWLIFRAAGQPVPSMSPANLAGYVDEPEMPNNVWDDRPIAESATVTWDFTYLDAAGDEQSGSVDITYDKLALAPSETYTYRMRRIVEPEWRAGSGSPVTQGIGTSQVTPDITVDPPESLGDGSAASNPVTYFTPVVLQSPDAGAVNQSTTSITFTWDATPGANEYLLQVFPEDDPDCLRLAVHQGPVMRPPGAGSMHWTISANFQPSSTFYWRVGARRSGEVEPVNGLGNQTGWLFSRIRSFVTAVAPPPPPGTSAVGSNAGKPAPVGWYGLDRRGH